MNKRFTFAVCISCGVQSPPIILDDKPAKVPQGWKFDKHKFSVMATCPQCLKAKNEKETVETGMA